MEAEISERGLGNMPKSWEEAPLAPALLLPAQNRDVKAGATAAILQPGGQNPCAATAEKKSRRNPWVPGDFVERPHQPWAAHLQTQVTLLCSVLCHQQPNADADWPSLASPPV